MKCKLCHEDKDICNSHILSEFLYDGLYDAKMHKFVKIAEVTNSESSRIFQKGLRERMLCEKCETILSDWEGYAKRVIFGVEGIEYECFNDFVVFRGIDYMKFKLFMLSMIWRAGASTRQEFANVDLGSHQEIIRQMLLAKDPGKSYEYGCMLIATPSYTEMMQGIILLPNKCRIDGYCCYQFIMAGLTWVFFVASRMDQFPHKENVFLSEEGILPIIIDENFAKKYIEMMAGDFDRRGWLDEGRRLLSRKKKKQ